MNKMVKALTHLRDHLVEGKPIPPDAGENLGAATWAANLTTIMRGGSANHGLIRHVLGMLRTEELSDVYLEERAEWELANGLCVNEQMSPSYGHFHIGCWLIVAVKGPSGFLRNLAHAWVERYLAVTACCSIIENGALRILTPGDRSDSGGLHNEEAVMVAKLLGLRGPESWGNVRSTLMLEAVGALDLDGVIGNGPRAAFRAIVKDKTKTALIDDFLEDARLMTLLHYRVYGPDSFAAWIERGRHPQDPAWLATVVDGSALKLADLPEPQPPEGGWKGRVTAEPRRLLCSWTRRDRLSSTIFGLPRGEPLRSLTIGAATDTPAPPEPEEASDTGWPPAPLGPMDPDSFLSKAHAHLEALAEGREGDHLRHARSNLSAWERTR